MKQSFYNADGTKTGETSDGSVMARIKALEAKIRQLTGAKEASPKPAPKATPTPKANPMGKKKFHDTQVNPDTGEIAAPGDPTVKFNGAPSCGSGPSYHFDGASAGGPAGGPMPLGVPVTKAPRSVGPHRHMPAGDTINAPSRMTQSVSTNPGTNIPDIHQG